MVTLTGPGGIGKTHLALVVASEQRRAYADSVVFVDLAPLRDHRLVPAAIVRALGLQETTGRSPERLLLDYLQERHILMLLDNFEHLLEAGPFLAEVLATCPRATALTTSRAALRVRGEHVYSVPPLSLPEVWGDAKAWRDSGAVALFAERAQAVRKDFAVVEANVSAVIDICRRLDGLPLAIELAAARMRVLPLKVLHEQLTDRLGLTTGGARDAPERQQTLRSTLDWSIGLLTPEQTALFRRLAVFVGGCSLEAVQAVCGQQTRRSVELIDTLEALVDHNLIRQVGLSEETARFSMLETIREYAAERLGRSGEADRLRQRHAEYFLSLAESAEPQLQGTEQSRWLDMLEVERANLQAAYGRFEDSGTERQQARLSAALWRFWVSHGHLAEGRVLAERALARLEAAHATSDLRVRTLNVIAVLTREQGDYVLAEQYFQRSLKLSQQDADLPNVAFALNGLGVTAWAQGRYELAEARYEESLEVRRRLGDDVGTATCLNNLGTLASDRGDYEAAWARHQESLALRRALREQRGIAQSLQNLGEVALRRGDIRSARELYRESLVLFRELGERIYVTRNLDALARVAEATGQADLAVRLLAAAAALREATRARLQLTDQSWYTRTVAELRVRLGETAFTASWAEGSHMSLSVAIEAALRAPVSEPRVDKSALIGSCTWNLTSTTHYLASPNRH
jgi:predicted ATPase